jgi:hypothetical protein
MDDGLEADADGLQRARLKTRMSGDERYPTLKTLKWIERVCPLRGIRR